jgi:alkanesulfonate monooxygenase SsuD/methylene tetrahydromethanopterin reductase-like flavin-dependent oxidoreductase (luciferase family)
MYEERLQPLESADRAGFFCYHLAEHHSTPLGMGPSLNVFLAALAMRTKQIHMGPLVYLLPLYHPVRLVEEICMLDNLSGGRLEIGVGRGVSPYELAHMNVNFLESRAIFEDSLKAIVKGLRERKIVHQGEYHRFTSTPIELAPKQHPNPPFWYGASTPEGLNFAARHRMQIVTGGPTRS